LLESISKIGSNNNKKEEIYFEKTHRKKKNGANSLKFSWGASGRYSTSSGEDRRGASHESMTELATRLKKIPWKKRGADTCDIKRRESPGT